MENHEKMAVVLPTMRWLATIDMFVVGGSTLLSGKGYRGCCDRMTRGDGVC